MLQGTPECQDEQVSAKKDDDRRQATLKESRMVGDNPKADNDNSMAPPQVSRLLFCLVSAWHIWTIAMCICIVNCRTYLLLIQGTMHAHAIKSV